MNQYSTKVWKTPITMSVNIRWSIFRRSNEHFTKMTQAERREQKKITNLPLLQTTIPRCICRLSWLFVNASMFHSENVPEHIKSLAIKPFNVSENDRKLCSRFPRFHLQCTKFIKTTFCVE